MSYRPVSLALGLAAGTALALGHFGVGGALAAAAALVAEGHVSPLGPLGTLAPLDALPRGSFDGVVDRYGEFFFFGGLAVHYRADRPQLSLALLALLGSFMMGYGAVKAEALRVQMPRSSTRRVARAVALCGGAMLSPLAAVLAEGTQLAPRFAEALAEAPMLIALAAVGLVSNVVAVRRLGALARAVQAPVATAVDPLRDPPAPPAAPAPGLPLRSPAPTPPAASPPC